MFAGASPGELPLVNVNCSPFAIPPQPFRIAAALVNELLGSLGDSSQLKEYMLALQEQPRHKRDRFKAMQDLP